MMQKNQIKLLKKILVALYIIFLLDLIWLGQAKFSETQNLNVYKVLAEEEKYKSNS